MSEKKFYVTTPLYYVNAEPHSGHAYTTILADVICRFRANFGQETFFLTGTDEHGQKVEEAAEKAGVEVQDFVDGVADKYKAAWKALNINYDYFMRTTHDYHKKAVAEVLQTLYDKGDIYKDTYTGEYCTPCERFWVKNDLVEGNCPDCGRKTKSIEESNYFFRMSKYQQKLIDHIKGNPGFIVPKSRANEVLGFLNKKLGDLCISRPKERLKWGIEIPFDKHYVTYVWFDALLNYATGVGYLNDEKKFEETYPADYHLLGKDILTTHAVYWITMLMAIEIPLPKRLLAHGWWMCDNDKMSKSKGNAISPLDYASEYGVDVYRYFLMKEMTLGQDSNFTHDNFLKTVNSDLANDLGNLISRTTKMISNYFGGVIPTPKLTDKEEGIKEAGNKAIEQGKAEIFEDKLNVGLETVMQFVRSINKYIGEEEPWALAKDESKKEHLGTVLYTCVESIRLATEFFKPVMPSKTTEAIEILGASQLKGDLLSWGLLKGGEKVSETKGLFPRLK